MAICLPPPAPQPSTARSAVAAAGSCPRCALRHYCAMYSPLSAGPPADCPFGPGPAALRK